MSTLPNRKLTRREILKLISYGAVGAALTACGPKTTEEPTVAATEVTGQEAVEEPTATVDPNLPTPEPTVAVNSYGTTDKPVVLWHGLTGTDGAVFATLLQKYAEANPDQGVRSEAYTWDVFFQKYPTAVAAGTPPDLAIFHAAEVQQMAAQGLMQPMDDVFTAMGLPVDDFGKPVLDACTVDGKKMAVPFDNHGWTNWINTKVVKDAGLDPNDLPKNGAEFIEWGKKIVVDEAGKHPGEDGFNPDKIKIWAHWFTWPRYSMVSTWLQFGGGAFDPTTNKATLNTPESVAAVQYWYDMMYTHFICPPALPGVPWAGDVYITDSLALMWEGTWTKGMMNDHPDIAEHTICVPINSLAPDGKMVQKLDAHIFSIPTGVPQDGIDRASKLIKYLSDNGAAWANSGQVPARLSVQKDPAVQELWSVKASADAFVKYGQTDFPHKAFIEIQTAWETAVGAALAKTTPIQQALDEGNAQIQAILDRA